MPTIHDGRCGGGIYYAVDCWSCLGEGRGCKVCKGSGALGYSQCPICLGQGHIRRAIQTYRWMKRGFLPTPGALLDQSHTMLSAYDLIERLYAHFESKRADREMKKHG